MAQGRKKDGGFPLSKRGDEFSASRGAELGERQQRVPEPDGSCGQGDAAAQALCWGGQGGD